MSTNELTISLWDEKTLLVKDLTMKDRYTKKSEQQVLSNNIYLPGYENKPIKIGFRLEFNSSNNFNGYLIAFVENCDFLPNDLQWRVGCDNDGKQSGNVHIPYSLVY